MLVARPDCPAISLKDIEPFAASSHVIPFLAMSSKRTCLVCAGPTVLLLTLIVGSTAAEKYLLYHVRPNDARGMRELRKLQMEDHKYQVDFWKEPNHITDFADIMISSKNALAMERLFGRANITFEIRVPDVEKLIIRNERTTKKRKTYGRDGRLHDDPILDSERKYLKGIA
ncbi:unnamed protein product [Strongylus vulgaris]|uniref:Carboxypeptidase activation peptide domain-containing protein n=1 Tax=Strongylus vulgaris TaxID=40348 RepID=A0A3P7JHF5_STRVU|nr:unnamed protein product [Strongylus vulgaris]